MKVGPVGRLGRAVRPGGQDGSGEPFHEMPLLARVITEGSHRLLFLSVKGQDVRKMGNL